MSETNATEPVRPGTRIRPGAVVEAMALSGIDRSASLGAALRQLRAAAASLGMTTDEYVVSTVAHALEHQPTVCPRCHGGIPTDDKVGLHPGARSRATEERDIEVCSRCGEHEAFHPVPVAEWPVDPAAEASLIRLLLNPVHEPSHQERNGGGA